MRKRRPIASHVERARRREGEPLHDYVQRVVTYIEPDGGDVYRGAVASAEGIRPWQEAALIGETGSAYQQKNPKVWDWTDEQREQAEKTLSADVPILVKRSGKERLDSLTSRLAADIERSYRALGRVELPPSLMREIQAEMWRQGIVVSQHELESLALPAAQEAVRAHSRRLLEKASRKNRRDLVPDVTRGTWEAASI